MAFTEDEVAYLSRSHWRGSPPSARMGSGLLAARDRVAFLPISGGLVIASNLAAIVLIPRFGPRPLIALEMLAPAGGRPGWPSSARTPATPPACSARSSWPPSAWA